MISGNISDHDEVPGPANMARFTQRRFTEHLARNKHRAPSDSTAEAMGRDTKIEREMRSPETAAPAPVAIAVLGEGVGTTPSGPVPEGSRTAREQMESERWEEIIGD